MLPYEKWSWCIVTDAFFGTFAGVRTFGCLDSYTQKYEKDGTVGRDNSFKDLDTPRIAGIESQSRGFPAGFWLSEPRLFVYFKIGNSFS